MELTAAGPRRVRSLSRAITPSFDVGALAGWSLAFTLVTYFALSDGGVDTVVRSQVGLAIWWIVLLGAVVGVLPGRVERGGWIAIGLLTAYAGWTGLAIGWSESAERSALELGRLFTYLGVFVLAVAVQGRAAARHTINGLASAIAVVTALALLSRLHPQWFTAQDANELVYPLNQGGALAVLVAVGAPLLLAVAVGARTLVGQAVAAASLPICTLCLYVAASAQVAALALGVGLLAFVVFAPQRGQALASLAPAVAASAILMSAASQRGARGDGLDAGEGTEMLWLVGITTVGVALLQVAIGLAARHLRVGPFASRVVPPWLPAVTVAVTLLVAIVGVSTAVDDSRDRLWHAALDAHADAPWTGIGAGAYELWSVRAAASPASRDAGSLYLRTLAEVGYIGLGLLCGFLFILIVAAIARRKRAGSELRLWLASAVGGLTAFVVASALETAWDVAAIAVVVVVLGAVAVCGREERGPGTDEQPKRAPRAALAVLAAVALVGVVVPMAGALANRDGRQAIEDGRLVAALAHTRTAERLQPYAATPRLLRAQVLEARGDLAGSLVAAQLATKSEPMNWRTWLVLARVQARRGDSVAALRALRQARRLGPRTLP